MISPGCTAGGGLGGGAKSTREGMQMGFPSPSTTVLPSGPTASMHAGSVAKSTEPSALTQGGGGGGPPARTAVSPTLNAAIAVAIRAPTKRIVLISLIVHSPPPSVNLVEASELRTRPSHHTTGCLPRQIRSRDFRTSLHHTAGRHRSPTRWTIGWSHYH